MPDQPKPARPLTPAQIVVLWVILTPIIFLFISIMLAAAVMVLRWASIIQ